MQKKDFLGSFNGNPITLILFLVLGIFIPPFLGMCAVYYLAKKYSHEPKYWDEKIFYFFWIQTGYLVLIGLVGRIFSSKSLYSFSNLFGVVFISIPFTMLVYFFINKWVEYDYLMYKKRIRGFQDTQFGQEINKTYQNFKNNFQKNKPQKIKVRDIKSLK